MGLLTDLWHLHREAILKVAGVCMLIAAAAVVIARGPGDAGDASAVGAAAGLVLRNLALPAAALPSWPTWCDAGTGTTTRPAGAW